MLSLKQHLEADNKMAINKLQNRRGMDLISDLPDHLRETILMKLPLRDSARTCILSSKWKDSWVKLPRLKLDAAFWKQSLQNESHGRVAEFTNILFRILLLHQGPITNISLHIPKLESPPGIDTLVNFVVRNGVQTFSLVIFPGEHYKLGSSLFSCPTLNHVYLKSCDINFLPSTFEKLNNLVTMKLVNVTISAETLERLVSSCPSLHSLILRLSIDIQCLKIISPSLRLFAYGVSSQTSLAVNYGQQQQGGILKLLGGSPNLKYLYLGNHCVKSLSAGGLPTRLPTNMLHHLSSLTLHTICLEDVDQFSSVLCLIRSSPNLQKFKVHRPRRTVNNNNMMENLQEEEYSDLILNHLVEVEILSVVGGRLEMKLIKILLEKSPSLRKMNISLATSKIADKGIKIIKEMFMFRRAAPKVEVLVKD